MDVVYAGQLDSYERANEGIEELSGVRVSTAQVYRLADAYGKAVEQEVNKQSTLTPVKKEEVLYVQADGSVLLTWGQG